MSEHEKPIICRQCGEAVDRTRANCPHCGASTGGWRGKLALVLIGALVIVFSLTRIQQLGVFGVIGLVVALVGANGLYDRRKRIQKAEAEVASRSTGDQEPVEQA
jgi:hypothetical protein